MITLHQPGGAQFPAPSVSTAEPIRAPQRLAWYDAGGSVPFTPAPTIPILAGCELPDDPRLGQRVLSFAAYPSLARAESVESFSVPPLGWLGTWPDTTRRVALHASQHLAVTTDPALEQRAVPALSWQPQAPDTTRRNALPASVLPFVFRSEALEQYAIPALSWQGVQPERTRRSALLAAHYVEPFTFGLQALAVQVPPLAWLNTYPDTTRRAILATAHYVSARAEAVEQFAVPPLSWLGSAPPTTRRAALLGAHYVDPLTYALQGLVAVAPPLSWQPVYPDRVWRQQLAATQILGARTDALEAFPPTLLWLPTYPDTTRRASLPTAQQSAYIAGPAIEQWTIPALSWLGSAPERYPFARPQTRIESVDVVLQALAIAVPPLSWAPSYPDATRRAALATAQYPALFKGEALEQLAATLLWYPSAPDRIPLLRVQTRIDSLTRTEAPATPVLQPFLVGELPVRRPRVVLTDLTIPPFVAAVDWTDWAPSTPLVRRALPRPTSDPVAPAGQVIVLPLLPSLVQRDRVRDLSASRDAQAMRAITSFTLPPPIISGWWMGGDPGWWHARPIQAFTTFAVTLVRAMDPGPRVMQPVGQAIVRAAAVGELLTRGPLVAQASLSAASVRHDVLTTAHLRDGTLTVAGVRDEQVEQ